MKLFAVDIGSKVLGWAVYTPDLGSGVSYDTAVLDVLGRERPACFSYFTIWVAAKFKRWRPDVVLYERPFCRGLHATRALWGIAGIVEAQAELADAAVVDVTSSPVRKHLGIKGKGREQLKAATMEWARGMGYDPQTEDEADALALLHYGMDNIKVGD